MLTTLATGFPFLVFGCFLASTLVAVPLVSIAHSTAWLLGKQLSPRTLFSIGFGLIASLWTIMIYFAFL
jgi:hypothetical protein